MLITLASSSLLSIFRALPVGLRLIYRVPASIIVLLPTVTGILVNVAVVPGIHIPAGRFTNRTVPPLRAGSCYFPSLGIRSACHCPISGGVMPGLGALVSSGNIGAAPLSIRIRTLSSLSISSCVRVIGLRCTPRAVRCGNRAAPSIGTRVWIVTSSGGRRSVRTISTRFPAVSARGGVIVRRSIRMVTIAPVSSTVRRGVGIVVTSTTVRWPPIATSIDKDRTCGSAQDERAQISSRVV